jgi:hypothetical protein
MTARKQTAPRKPRDITIKDMARGAADLGLRLEIGIEPESMPIRTKMREAKDYDDIDRGIVFAVKVLHAAGIATCQSCQGGEGHCYPEPSVDLVAGPSDSDGFAALAALRDYGLPVSRVMLVWDIQNGLPYSKLWRITFVRSMEDRADDWPSFEHCYRAFVKDAPGVSRD